MTKSQLKQHFITLVPSRHNYHTQVITLTPLHCQTYSPKKIKIKKEQKVPNTVTNIKVSMKHIMVL